MSKRRNLNGLPHNFTQSFFGSLRYYNGGYMGDWLLNAARHLNLETATLNVLSASFNPSELNMHPPTFHASSLKQIIVSELQANGFESDFITEAHINFQFPDVSSHRTIIYCYPYMIDKQGRRYEPGRIIAQGLEPSFDAFNYTNLYTKPKTLLDRIKSLFG